VARRGCRALAGPGAACLLRAERTLAGVLQAAKGAS
jgi:hypothetical protein